MTHPSGPAAAVAARAVAQTPGVNVADAADDVVTEVLLRCWTREFGPPPHPGDARLRLELPTTGLTVDVAVTYRSATGWHRFDRPRLGGVPLDAGLLAALLIREAAAGAPAAAGRTALARVLDSAGWIARIIAFPRLAPAEPFLAAERALVTGHPFHPAAKNRGEAPEAECARYSPELDGSFPLHWFAAHPDIARHGGPDPSALLASLRGAGPGLPALPAGYLALPAHPWQARAVPARPDVASLLADGRLVDLGPAGPPWFPTASLRTVWRPDAPVMLKLSLGMRITNSRRTLHRDELELGAEMARYARLALDGWLRDRHPAFRLVGEPSWVGARADGLECAVRTNPFGAGDRVACAAALVADRPDLEPGAPGRSRRSMLAGLISQLAGPASTGRASTGRASTGAVAREWFARYLRVLVIPVLDLYLRRGVGLEAHLQNTLVSLDERGWPVAGWYRDSQGYYLAASRAEAARREVPGLGEGLPAVFDDDLVEQRVVYYAVVNNALAVVGALGAAGIADEPDLLRCLREALLALRSELPGHGLLDRLLDAPTLPCKANLRMCVDGRDELVGPVASQSVYVEIPNPLVEVRT
ncbi:IucA/IucC family protein [Parafrankia discariae]|uniref:IucA/IucC family protein n=1 Tax=Parafrankia discariae TaxID=365528 RepID=UPI00035E554B|nr:IucA/IucC family protein [Parafrankia discariae]